MPYKSKAQMRMMFAKEKAGEVPQGTAQRWADETPDIKNLPEHKKQAEWVGAFIKMAIHLMDKREARMVPSAITLRDTTNATKQQKQQGMDGIQYRNYLANKKRNIVSRGAAMKPAQPSRKA